MAYTFRGPVSMDKLAHFVSDVITDFGKVWGSSLKSSTVLWDVAILQPERMRLMLSDSDLRELSRTYETIVRDGSLTRLIADPSQIGMTINSSGAYGGYGGRWMEGEIFKTRIFNVSRIRELLTAEGHFPHPMREYLISTWLTPEPGYSKTDGRISKSRSLQEFHEEFIAYRDHAFNRALDSIAAQQAVASITRDIILGR